MVRGHIHVQCCARIPQVLCYKNSTFLSNKESSLEFVTLVSFFTRSKEGKILTLKVLQPTLSGQIDRSQTLSSSTTPPCFAIELPSRGAMLHVPRECQVVSTWRWTMLRQSKSQTDHAGQNIPHFSMCWMSSLEYSRGLRTSCWFELRIEAAGFFPASKGCVQEPTTVNLVYNFCQSTILTGTYHAEYQQKCDLDQRMPSSFLDQDLSRGQLSYKRIEGAFQSLRQHTPPCVELSREI